MKACEYKIVEVLFRQLKDDEDMRIQDCKSII